MQRGVPGSGDLYSNEFMRISPSWSGDPHLARIVFFGVNGHMVANNLRTQNLHNQQNEPELELEYVGQHAGMPLNELWAMSLGRRPIQRLVPTIVRQARSIIET